MRINKPITALAVAYFSFLCINSVFSQDWVWQNPYPTGNSLYCSEFVDSLTGWFGTSGGVILHTKDGGLTWESQFTGLNYIIKSINFIDTREGWATGLPRTVFHTSDGGEHWAVRAWINTVHNFRIIRFIDAKHGWIGTSRGRIRYTTDGGLNWEIGYDCGDTNLQNITSIAMLDTSNGWAAGVGIPLLKTTDGGKSWVEVTSIDGWYIHFSDALHGWITSTNGRLWRTSDSGDTWLQDRNLPDPHDIIEVYFFDTLHGWVTTTNAGIFHTIDGGLNWEQITIENLEIERQIYHFFTPDFGWIDFWLTRDGGNTLNHQRTGFTLEDLRDVDFVDEDIGWVVGEEGVIGKTTDGGKNWNVILTDATVDLDAICAVDNRNVWITGREGTILNTTDGGNNWSIQTQYADIEHPHHLDVEFTDTLNGWIVGWGDDSGWILHTEDGGINWVNQLAEGLPTDGWRRVTFVNDSIGWALPSGGWLLHTTDGGANWEYQIERFQDQFKSFFFLNKFVGWIGGEKYILKTTDGGTSWDTISVITRIPYDIHFINEDCGWFCGLGGDIFHSDDGGETWYQENTETGKALYSIDFTGMNSGWAVGRDGTIIHKTPADTVSVDDFIVETDIPEEVSLLNNYPNPFNDSTVILYSIKRSGHVKLTVFNVRGEEVIRLVDGIQTVGEKHIKWNGQNSQGGDMPSGIYFYRMEFAANGHLVSKMLLIR